MKIYRVYQINFTDAEVEKINSRDPDFRPTYETYLDATCGYDEEKHVQDVRKALFQGLYKMACLIKAEDLNDVFQIGNIGPEAKIARVGVMHSISVGDIVEDTETNELYVVARFGFEKVWK